MVNTSITFYDCPFSQLTETSVLSCNLLHENGTWDYKAITNWLLGDYCVITDDYKLITGDYGWLQVITIQLQVILRSSQVVNAVFRYGMFI